MIVTRYIIREIATSFLIVVTALVLIYVGYSTSTVLAEAANRSLQPAIILHLIFLSSAGVLDLILATAFYFSVILALGRIHRDSEMIALMASGYSEWQLMRAVFYAALAVALAVGFLSLIGRPWAYRMSYNLEARAMDELDVDKLQPRAFTELKHSKDVLYAAEVDSDDARLGDVLLQSDSGPGKTRVITANALHLPKGGETTRRPAEFENGHLYLLDRKGEKDSILQFETLGLYLKGEGSAAGHRRKAVETVKLLQSTNPREIAELQWRFASPLATVLLALLAIPLSRARPRQRRFSRLIPVILVYALFFNLLGVARSWVEHERIAAIPGIWWVHMLCLGLFLGLSFRPRCMSRQVNQ
jgi:lipopolysaccharide export system permease protein